MRDQFSANITLENVKSNTETFIHHKDLEFQQTIAMITVFLEDCTSLGMVIKLQIET